ALQRRSHLSLRGAREFAGRLLSATANIFGAPSCIGASASGRPRASHLEVPGAGGTHIRAGRAGSRRGRTTGAIERGRRGGWRVAVFSNRQPAFCFNSKRLVRGNGASVHAGGF